jgi:hypothetical protein
VRRDPRHVQRAERLVRERLAELHEGLTQRFVAARLCDQPDAPLCVQRGTSTPGAVVQRTSNRSRDLLARQQPLAADERKPAVGAVDDVILGPNGAHRVVVRGYVASAAHAAQQRPAQVAARQRRDRHAQGGEAKHARRRISDGRSRSLHEWTRDDDTCRGHRTIEQEAVPEQHVQQNERELRAGCVRRDALAPTERRRDQARDHHAPLRVRQALERSLLVKQREEAEAIEEPLEMRRTIFAQPAKRSEPEALRIGQHERRQQQSRDDAARREQRQGGAHAAHAHEIEQHERREHDREMAGRDGVAERQRCRVQVARPGQRERDAEQRPPQGRLGIDGVPLRTRREQPDGGKAADERFGPCALLASNLPCNPGEHPERSDLGERRHPA